MKHVGYILGIAVIIFLFFLLILAELAFFDVNPPQLPVDTSMKQWKASFQKWAFWVVGAAGVASLLWYVLAHRCFFKINNQQAAGKRMVWVLFFLFPIGAIVLGVLFIDRAESGLEWAYLFFVLNGLPSYYLATLLFSPSSFKYTPLLANPIRRWLWW